MTFSFWKSAKKMEEEVKAPLLSDDADAAQEVHASASVGTTTAEKVDLDLDPGCKDSGKFTFEDMEQLAQWSHTSSPQQHHGNASSAVAFTTERDDQETPLLCDEQIDSDCQSLLRKGSESTLPSVSLESAELLKGADLPSQELLPAGGSTRLESAALKNGGILPHDRDFGVFLDDTESASTEVVAHDSQLRRPSSFSTRQTPSTDKSVTRQTAPTDTSAASRRINPTARQLHRPTELNLSSAATNSSKPQSELEKRFNLMRNSKSTSKAALRSPTQLLKERLNMSPRQSTSSSDEKVRVFVPPQPSRNGCLLPGPAGGTEAFTSASVRARTGAGDRPAWWCKTDKLVIFDGIEVQAKGEMNIFTRTSKGLSIARRRGDTETILIPMDCAHCQEMLNRHEWRYDIQVCKRNVCRDCKERCKWEHEQERKDQDKSVVTSVEGKRYRADSVLQDDAVREEELMHKMGIEQGRPKSPVEALGGIEERMESTKVRI